MRYEVISQRQNHLAEQRLCALFSACALNCWKCCCIFMHLLYLQTNKLLGYFASTSKLAFYFLTIFFLFKGGLGDSLSHYTCALCALHVTTGQTQVQHECTLLSCCHGAGSFSQFWVLSGLTSSLVIMFVIPSRVPTCFPSSQCTELHSLSQCSFCSLLCFPSCYVDSLQKALVIPTWCPVQPLQQ